MRSNNPAFRALVANLEKASTGKELKDALAKYDPDFEESSDPNRFVGRDATNGWKGALPFLNLYHTSGLEQADPEWFIPPQPGTGIIILDFNPDYDRIDQNGDPI